jgi:hypothetical protein
MEELRSRIAATEAAINEHLQTFRDEIDFDFSTYDGNAMQIANELACARHTRTELVAAMAEASKLQAAATAILDAAQDLSIEADGLEDVSGEIETIDIVISQLEALRPSDDGEGTKSRVKSSASRLYR